MKGAMVRAILDGTKTQTRRIVKPQDIDVSDGVPFLLPYASGVPEPVQVVCPQGRPGDRLWVRETFADVGWPPTGPQYVYRADPDSGDNDVQKWKPSIFMPRWASRIALEVVSVRVERLQKISEDDARAEGVGEGPQEGWVTGPVVAYADLWDSINGRDAWLLNPWVWVIEFKRIEP